MDRSPHWNEQWDKVEAFTPLQGESLFTHLLDGASHRTPSPARERTAIEIGCFPGQFIDHLAGRGYRVSGIDTYAGVGRLNDQLAVRGRLVGCFVQAALRDFAAAYEGEGFDFVLSLGFVEHFEHFCDVLYDHVRLTRVGGRVVVGAPNFATPFQRALHQSLDPKNLANHVLEAMYPSVWATFLASVGIDVHYAGNLGGFCFWAETQLDDPCKTQLQSIVTRLGPGLSTLGTRFNETESGYAVVIGTKVCDTAADPQHASRVAAQAHAMARTISARDESLSRQYGAFLDYLVEP